MIGFHFKGLTRALLESSIVLQRTKNSLVGREDVGLGIAGIEGTALKIVNWGQKVMKFYHPRMLVTKN